LPIFGFVPTSQRGSHVRFTHADGRSTVVPHHARDDLDRWLLLKVVKAAGIDAGSFFGGP
jgi:predicted RNA binding protein YcfA (HicA-like mRNA interferase family)